MDLIPDQPLKRLAKKAGVKSISKKCYKKANLLIDTQIIELMKKITTITDNRDCKTISEEDFIKCMKMIGINITTSSCLGTRIVNK